MCSQNEFYLEVGLETPQKRTETKKHVSAELHFKKNLLCILADVLQGSLLVFFHLCLVSVVSSGSSLFEMNFCSNSFPSSYCKNFKNCKATDRNNRQKQVSDSLPCLERSEDYQ